MLLGVIISLLNKKDCISFSGHLNNLNIYDLISSKNDYTIKIVNNKYSKFN